MGLVSRVLIYGLAGPLIGAAPVLLIYGWRAGTDGAAVVLLAGSLFAFFLGVVPAAVTGALMSFVASRTRVPAYVAASTLIGGVVSAEWALIYAALANRFWTFPPQAESLGVLAALLAGTGAFAGLVCGWITRPKA